MFQRDLSRMIIRIRDICGDAVVLTECWSQLVSGSVDNGPIGTSVGLLLTVRPASWSARKYITRLTERQAQCLVPGICVVLCNEMVPLRANIGQSQHRRPG